MNAAAEIIEQLSEQRAEQLRRLKRENAGLRATIRALTIWDEYQKQRAVVAAIESVVNAYRPYSRA